MTLIHTVKTICERGGGSLAQDAVGACALGVMLIVALHLPALT